MLMFFCWKTNRIIDLRLFLTTETWKHLTSEGSFFLLLRGEMPSLSRSRRSHRGQARDMWAEIRWCETSTDTLQPRKVCWFYETMKLCSFLGNVFLRSHLVLSVFPKSSTGFVGGCVFTCLCRCFEFGQMGDWKSGKDCRRRRHLQIEFVYRDSTKNLDRRFTCCN